MSVVRAVLVAVLAELEADPELAANVARVLGSTGPTEIRIPLADVTAHGAPSADWCRRHKLARGPRRGRYVLAAELEAALAASTIVRRTLPSVANTLEDDAHAAVVDLAARRASRLAF